MFNNAINKDVTGALVAIMMHGYRIARCHGWVN